MTGQDVSGRGWAAGQARPHRWPCRHCGMVTDYHLVRDAQLRAVESLDRRDEIDQLITFKEWLRVYEWDTDPRRDDGPAATAADPWGADRDTGWGYSWSEQAAELRIPQQRVPVAAGDPVADARRAVAAIPDLDYPRAGAEWPMPYTVFGADQVEDDGRTRDEARAALAAAGSYR